MKKRIKFICMIGLCVCWLTACDTETSSSSDSEIQMPNASTDYVGSAWTLESLTEHFKELGFTSFEKIPCEPDEDDYHDNIFVVEICTGWASEDPWEAGESFNFDDKIIIYYNEFPILTVENCSDLKTVLTSKDIDYMTFAEKYDGRYVEFDAYVTNHLTYHGDTSHIIDVTGGDYDGEGELGYYDEEDCKGLLIRIGNRMCGNSIIESIEEGQNVTVSGKIDASWCEYYEQLYIECSELNKR